MGTDGWMDVLFNIISVILGRWVDDNERLVHRKQRLKRFSPLTPDR